MAARSGGATVATDHTGYTGTGFVAGYGTLGAATTFTVTAGTAGTYQAALRFSNGPNPFAGTPPTGAPVPHNLTGSPASTTQ